MVGFEVVDVELECGTFEMLQARLSRVLLIQWRFGGGVTVRRIFSVIADSVLVAMIVDVDDIGFGLGGKGRCY